MYKKIEMKNIIALISFIVMISLWGCQPEPIRIDIEPLPTQIVVVSQIIPDRIMTIVLTKTIGALDTGNDSVSQDLVNELFEKNAKVTISYRDVTHDLVELQDGIYTSIDILQHPNEVYKLNIITADGKHLTSTTSMLPKIDVNGETDTLTPNIVRSTVDTIVYFDYKFKDLPEKNWYMINFYKRGENNNEPNIENFFSGGSEVATTILFDDILSDDGFISGTAELTNLIAKDTLVVSVSNISEDFYNYLQTRITSQGVISELFKEPIPAPTNVEGGIGFFNTHFPTFRVYDLNEY